MLRAHARTAAVLFGGIGLQVGAWSAGVAQIALDLHLSSGALGVSLSAGAAGGIGSLLLAGRAADRLGRRPVTVLGGALLSVAWLALGPVRGFSGFVALQVLYGASAGLLDLGANAVGSDVERAHDVRVMPRLHAAFSGAAAVGALGAGAAFGLGASRSAVFAAVALVLAGVVAVAALAGLPAHRDEPTTTSVDSPAAPARVLLAMPGVLAATGIVSLCFLGDGALEGYTAVYLRTLVGAGPLGAGVALALFYGAQAAARFAIGRVLARHGERRVLGCAALLASSGVLGLVLAREPAVAMAALLLTGAALAPIVPVALSLAGRSAPGRSGEAVAVATAVGWSAFLLGPALVGAIADLTSLRAALGVVAISALAVAALARVAPGLTRAHATSSS